MQANVNDTRGVDGAPLTPLELGAWRGMLAVHASLVQIFACSTASAIISY